MGGERDRDKYVAGGGGERRRGEGGREGVGRGEERGGEALHQL